MEILREQLSNLTNNSLKLNDPNSFNVKKEKYDYVIPNNNNKFFLYITESLKLETISKKEKSLVLYFCGKEDDFCIEISYTGLENFIGSVFEGFLYKENDKYTYTIFDVIYLSSKKIINETTNYSSRYLILTEIFSTAFNFNTILTIQLIQPFYTTEDYSIYSLRKTFTHYLFFSENSQNKIIQPIEKNELKKDLLISKGTKTEIYEVRDPESNDYLGILYVPTLQTSMYLKQLFIDNSQTVLKIPCTFNYQFKKWKIIF